MSPINTKAYVFDIIKVDKIIYILIKGRQLKLSDANRLLNFDEVKDKKYCKFHDRTCHTIDWISGIWSRKQLTKIDWISLTEN